ncbi:MAG: D-2-hydroxyacid dehydrogenase [Clostridiales bacterium]|nr:D-2-hydroxyacid dehydrogenase [Clostridiales bacterium]
MKDKLKIVVLDGYTLNPGDLSWSGLEQLGECKVYDRTSYEEVLDRIGDAQIIYTNKTPITREIIEKSSNLKWIGVLATGYNVVDTQAAKERGIPVANIPTYGTAAVAQMVFAHLLEICHHVSEHSNAVKNGEWTVNPDFCFWKYPLIELAGKTMGLIGYGRIGQATGKIAQALGMKVLAYDNYQNPGLENESMQYVSLQELLKQSDVISLHCPLLDSTKGMINRDTIAEMKDSAILINTSRGPLIVEEDLADALNNDKIYAAAVDVVSVEPIQEDNPLLKAKNMIITPHIAWAPKESRERLMQRAVDNLKSFLDGKPNNVVNL